MALATNNKTADDLNRIMSLLGISSSVELGRRLGLAKTTVRLWVNRDSIPPHYVRALSEMTGGQVTCHEIRPDIFPKP